MSAPVTCRHSREYNAPYFTLIIRLFASFNHANGCGIYCGYKPDNYVIVYGILRSLAFVLPLGDNE